MLFVINEYNFHSDKIAGALHKLPLPTMCYNEVDQNCIELGDFGVLVIKFVYNFHFE